MVSNMMFDMFGNFRISTKSATLESLVLCSDILNNTRKYQHIFKKYYSCKPENRTSWTRWTTCAQRVLKFDFWRLGSVQVWNFETAKLCVFRTLTILNYEIVILRFWNYGIWNVVTVHFWNQEFLVVGKDGAWKIWRPVKLFVGKLEYGINISLKTWNDFFW